MAVNDWQADEVLLSTLGWNVEVASVGTPAKRGGHVVIPQRSGVLPRFNRSSEAGEFKLSMWVLGCTSAGVIPADATAKRAQFDTNLNDLLRVFGQDSHAIVFKRVEADLTNKVASVLVTDSVDVQTMMSRQRGVFECTFEVLDSFWRDENPLTNTAVAGATLPKTLTFGTLAGGTAPIEDLVVTVTGPAVNPRVTNPESGAWVQYTGSLIATDLWVVDSALFTSKKNGASVLSLTTHGLHPRFVYVPPRSGNTNVPTLVLSGTGGGVTTNLSVTGYRKWLLP